MSSEISQRLSEHEHDSLFEQLHQPAVLILPGSSSSHSARTATISQSISRLSWLLWEQIHIICHFFQAKMPNVLWLEIQREDFSLDITEEILQTKDLIKKMIILYWKYSLVAALNSIWLQDGLVWTGLRVAERYYCSSSSCIIPLLMELS